MIKKHSNIENNFAKTSKWECYVTTIVELHVLRRGFYELDMKTWFQNVELSESSESLGVSVYSPQKLQFQSENSLNFENQIKMSGLS